MSLPPNIQWQKIEVNYSGQYVYIIGKDDATNITYIYTSNDYGKSWTLSNTPQTIDWNPPSNIFWYNVATNTTGQYIIGAGIDSYQNNYLYVSNDYGNTWAPPTTILPTTIQWSQFVFSSSGQYMYAVGLDNVDNYLYVSTNYGVIWSQVPAIPTIIELTNIVTSASGQYTFAIGKYGTANYVYVSQNYGTLWFQSTIPLTIVSWNNIVISSSGQTIYVTGKDGGGNNYLYVSNNYGNTWFQANIPTTIYLSQIVTNDSGQYVFVSGQDMDSYASAPESNFRLLTSSVINSQSNYIFYSENYGTTWIQTNTPTEIYLLAISGSGQYVYASGQDANGNNYVYSKEAYPNPSPPTPPPPPPPQPFIPFYKKQTNNLSKNQLRGTLINALKGGQMRFGGDNSGPNYLGRIEGQNGGGGAPIRNQF
jgi:hypothetical protein